MAQFGHLASGAAWSTAGKAIQLGSSLLALAVIARLVGPHVYGVFALGWLVVGLFEVLVSSAPTDTLIQRDRVSPGHLNATFWAALLMSLLIAGGVWAGADLADHWLEGGALLAAILPARAAVLPLQALAVAPTALLLRDSRFKAVAGAETVASIVSNLAGVALALAGTGIWSLVGMELVRAFVLCVALYAITRWRPGVAMRPSHLGDLLAFNASTWGSWGLGYLSSQLPRFVLAATLGAQAVGFYALAQRLFDQVKNIVMIPAYQVVQAGVARAQNDRDTARRLADGTLRVTGVVACPLFLGIAALAPVMVPAVFGDSWNEAVRVQLGAVFNAGLASLLMAAGVWGVSRLLAPSLPAPVLLPLLVAFGAFLYWALLKWSMPAAARVIQDVAVAIARRDMGAVRSSLGGLAA